MKQMDYVIVVDTSFIIDAVFGCKDRLIDFTSKFLLELMKLRKYNGIKVVMPKRVKEEILISFKKSKEIQKLISAISDSIEEKNIDKYDKEGFHYGDAGCVDTAYTLSKERKRPIILTNDESFIKKYLDSRRIHEIFNSKDFVFYKLPDFVCFEPCNRF